MMLGVVASRLAQSAGGGGDLPGDALAAADFVAGAYEVAGVAVTAADVVDHPEFIGAGGLAVPGSDPAGVISILGDFLATLTPMDWTVLIEYEELTSSGRTVLLSVSDIDFAEAFDTERMNAGLAFRAEDSAAGYRSIDDGTGFAGVHRLAITRTDTKLAMSVDGAATLVDDSITMTIAATIATVGGYTGESSMNAFNLRKLYVWAPMADGDLPGISG